ncbi:hypothetical protein Tco_0913482 [Tanacetum coccineum]
MDLAALSSLYKDFLSVLVLVAKWVVLGIKIDSYNLAPTYVRRYTVTKYYGNDINALNKHSGSSSSSTTMAYSNVNIPSSLNDFDMADYIIDDNNIGKTINEDEEKMMDDLMWGKVCETRDSLHVQVQDMPAHGIDLNIMDYQVDENAVDEAVVSEP